MIGLVLFLSAMSFFAVFALFDKYSKYRAVIALVTPVIIPTCIIIPVWIIHLVTNDINAPWALFAGLISIPFCLAASLLGAVSYELYEHFKSNEPKI